MMETLSKRIRRVPGYFLATLFAVGQMTVSQGHDTWVEVNTPEVRLGNPVHIDLKLGNHGNDHRDFKLHSLITLDHATLSVIEPCGCETDLIPRLHGTAYEPKQGYWTGRFVTSKAGLHAVAHRLDVLHRTTRAIKSGKAFFFAGDPSDELGGETALSSRPMGHALELVPLTHPIVEAGAGKPFRVRVLFRGEPLANARVTSIPRGGELAEGFDPDFERMTGADGEAEFAPAEANVYLFVVHLRKPEERGDGYDATHYSATLTVAVPTAPLSGAE